MQLNTYIYNFKQNMDRVSTTHQCMAELHGEFNLYPTLPL